jgi:hypothetical protein
MSPPPTSIDGTDITGATIDGTDVQEITVDGQTVFTAGPDVPDSVVNRAPLDEGSGTSFTDVVGDADGTLSQGGSWVSDSAFNGGTAPEFGDSGDYGEWQARSSVPITVTCRVRKNPFKISSRFYFIWGYNSLPKVGWDSNNNNWAAEDENNANRLTVSDSLSNGDVRILAFRLDSSEMALDVYQNDATTKVGSDSVSNPNTGFSGETMYIGDSGPNKNNEWTDAIDFPDIHDEFISDIDSMVAEVYGD